MCSNFKQSFIIFTVLINFNYGKEMTKLIDKSNVYTNAIRWLDYTFMNVGVPSQIKQVTKSSKNLQRSKEISRINEIVSENTKYSTNNLQKAFDSKTQLKSGKKVSVKMLSFKPVLVNIKTNNFNEIGTKSIRHESMSKISLDAEKGKRRQFQHAKNYYNGNFNPSQVQNPLLNRNIRQRWLPFMNMQRQVGWRPLESFKTNVPKQPMTWRQFYTEHPYIKGPGGPSKSGRHPLNIPTFSQKEPYKVETQTYRVDKNLLALRQQIDVEVQDVEIQGGNDTVLTTPQQKSPENEFATSPTTTRLRFTTITTTTTIRRKTASLHRVFENYCDYHAYYCLKAFDTSFVCARTRMNLYTTFRNYCEVNFVNCIEGFIIWQIVHMGACQELNTLSEINDYVNQNDKFLEEYYVSLAA